MDKYGYSNAILGSVDQDHIRLKQAGSSGNIKESHIIIVSKDIKDSHYESYVYCFGANKDGKDMHIVSYFMKELYLGQYMIKRNFYFENKDDAESMHSDLESQTENIRDEYYSSNLKNHDVPVKMQNYLSEKSGDIKATEDSIGTTVSRDHVRDDSSVREWFERGKETVTKDNIDEFKKESKITEDSYLRMLKKSSDIATGLIKTAEAENDGAEESETISEWHEKQFKICEKWRENSFVLTAEEEHLDISDMYKEEKE